MTASAAPPQPIATAVHSRAIPFRFWQLAALVVFTSLIYYQIIIKLVNDWWTDPNFSHGFFVPFFSVFVVWQMKDKLRAIEVRPSWGGLAIVILGLATLLAGVLGAELFLSRFSLVVLIGGLIVYCFGWAYFRALLFPWAFLFAMIPFPAIIMNELTFPLQFLASRLAAGALPWAGVPVLREGNVIQLAAMKLEVVEACSGIRSLVSLVTLAIMYGYFLEPKVWKRAVLAVAAVPIAVAANGLRIFGTGLCVQYWDPEKAEGFFHSFSGWIIFLLSLALLLAVHKGADLASRLVRRTA